jgi:hypothetical protein
MMNTGLSVGLSDFAMSLGIPVPNLTNVRRGGGGGGMGGGAGIGSTLLIVAAIIIAVFGGTLALVFGAQLSSTSLFSGLPASNQTAVNGNLGKAVVAGSQFMPLVYLGGFGALALAIFLLIFVILRHVRS